jgi:hypothetical protein
MNLAPGQNPDGSLKTGVIYLDPADGEVKSVKEDETVFLIPGNYFHPTNPTADSFLRIPTVYEEKT